MTRTVIRKVQVVTGSSFLSRSPLCGRCTRNDAGTSFPPETASVNNTRTSWAKAGGLVSLPKTTPSASLLSERDSTLLCCHRVGRKWKITHFKFQQQKCDCKKNYFKKGLIGHVWFVHPSPLHLTPSLCRFFL